jgi:hypothetical protein
LSPEEFARNVRVDFLVLRGGRCGSLRRLLLVGFFELVEDGHSLLEELLVLAVRRPLLFLVIVGRDPVVLHTSFLQERSVLVRLHL